MAITPSQSTRREVENAAKYFRRLQRREGLTPADKQESYYASWDGWSGWRPKGYSYERRPLPPSDPNDPSDSEDTDRGDSEPEDCDSEGSEPEDVEAGGSRKRAREEDDTNASYVSDGITYIRRFKKQKVYHVQVAKPLNRKQLQDEDTSEEDTSDIGLKVPGNVGKTQYPTPPPSSEGASSSSSSHLDNMTPALLGRKDTSLSGGFNVKFLLGNEINQMILEECEAAESQ